METPPLTLSQHLLTSFRAVVITWHWSLCLLLIVGDCYSLPPIHYVSPDTHSCETSPRNDRGLTM